MALCFSLANYIWECRHTFISHVFTMDWEAQSLNSEVWRKRKMRRTVHVCRVKQGLDTQLPRGRVPTRPCSWVCSWRFFWLLALLSSSWFWILAMSPNPLNKLLFVQVDLSGFFSFCHMVPEPHWWCTFQSSETLSCVMWDLEPESWFKHWFWYSLAVWPWKATKPEHSHLCNNNINN